MVSSESSAKWKKSLAEGLLMDQLYRCRLELCLLPFLPQQEYIFNELNLLRTCDISWHCLSKFKHNAFISAEIENQCQTCVNRNEMNHSTCTNNDELLQTPLKHRNKKNRNLLCYVLVTLNLSDKIDLAMAQSWISVTLGYFLIP